MKTNTPYTLILNGVAHHITIGPDVLEDLSQPDPDDPRDEASRIFDALMATVVDDPNAPQPALTEIAFLQFGMGVDT